MDIYFEEFYRCVDEAELELFSEIATYADRLGYKAKRAKTKDINYVFTNSKTKKNLLKFSIEKGKPVLKMKYYASTEYSTRFQEAIRMTIEEYDYRYTGCYHCGKCQGKPEGYIYQYEDGRRFFRCGSELISISQFEKKDLPEIIKLLEIQHRHFLGGLNESKKY